MRPKLTLACSSGMTLDAVEPTIGSIVRSVAEPPVVGAEARPVATTKLLSTSRSRQGVDNTRGDVGSFDDANAGDSLPDNAARFDENGFVAFDDPTADDPLPDDAVRFDENGFVAFDDPTAGDPLPDDAVCFDENGLVAFDDPIADDDPLPDNAVRFDDPKAGTSAPSSSPLPLP